MNAPTNATQAKDRLYAQLATSLKRMSRAVGYSADLFEQLQVDLDAMRTLAGIHAAQYVVLYPCKHFGFQYNLCRFMTVAAELNPDTQPAGEERT
jgi:hypothetical protein